MESKWNNEWERDSEAYTPDQVESVIRDCGIDISSQTSTHFLGYCPFHHNADTPAFAVDKEKGLWTCFNPSCGESGNLKNLLFRLQGLNVFAAERRINKYKTASGVDALARLEAVKYEEPDFVQFPEEPVQRMQEDLWAAIPGWKARDYLHNRGFEDETLKHFGIGYSQKQDMTVVPMHDPTGMLIGFIGRSIEGKRFKNSTNLPKSKTAWNFHRAKRHGESVIIVESSFDAMRVHQAGYPNVIALLGGHVTEHHLQQIGKTFSKVIIMTDFDPKIYRPNCRKCATYSQCQGHRPGRELGWSIQSGLKNKTVYWAAYDDDCVYPHGAKDAGDMTDDEIRYVLAHAVSNFEYSLWGIEDKEVVAS